MEELENYECFNCGCEDYIPIVNTEGELVEAECVECGARLVVYNED